MKKAHWIFFIVIFSQVSLLAQTTSDSVYAYNCIKIYPLNYFSSYEYNIGYERVINNKSSVEIILAYNYGDMVYYEPFGNSGLDFMSIPFGYLEVQSPKHRDAIGGSIRLGYRFYTGKKNDSPLGTYLSPQIMLKLTSMDSIRFTGEYYYAEDYDLIQKGITAKMLFGFQTRIKFVTFDYFFGVGIRYKHLISTRLRYKVEVEDDQWEWVDDNKHTRTTHNYIYPTIHLGVSIGVLF